MNIGNSDIEILNVDELKDWFFQQYQATPAEFRSNPCEYCRPIYVSTGVRRDYLLQHKNILLGGRFYTIEFENMRGGVWKASLIKNNEMID